MANGPEQTKKELQRIGEEAAAIFEDALTSIAATFGAKLREETQSLDDSQKILLRNFKNNIQAAARGASSLLSIQDKLIEGSLTQNDITKAQTSLSTQINKIRVEQLALQRQGITLSAKEEERALDAVNLIKERKKELEEIVDVQKEIEKSLGLVGTAFKAIGGVLNKLGISDPFTEAIQATRAARSEIALNNKAIDKLRDANGKIPIQHIKTVAAIKVQNKKLKDQTSLSKNLLDSLGERLTLQNLIAAAGAKVLDSLFVVNEAQTEFRRLTGESATGIGLLNDGLVTSSELIKTQVDLTNQFGINSRLLFPPEVLQRVSEVTKAIGLTTESSGNLARFSKLAGDNFSDQLDSVTRITPKAFSQKQILEETGNVSSDIALSFGNSVKQIGKAVIEARKLGLTISQINGIADSLLDIESSIAAEFEAEVISGKSLNFEKARLFALNNDIAGLTQEIAENEELTKDFANASRVEQQALAATLGMNRQQMADMVMKSDTFNTLTQEQKLNASGLTAEAFEQLTIQQSIETSINKITEALAGPIEQFAQLIQFAVKYANIIAAVVAGTTAIRAVNTAIIAQQKLKNNLSKKEALIEAAKAATSALRNPIALVAGVLAAGVAYAAASSFINKAGDAIIPSGGRGPIISPKEGGLIQGTPNDDILMAPGIAGGSALGNRNTPSTTTVTLSDQQIQKIANAVREGASKATINLDGDRVSSRLQTPMVLNTLPGV